MTLPVTGLAGVTLGQIDTFEDGTTQGWVVGLLGAVHPAPPQNISAGGPAGADDHYLLLSAVGGGGAGSRLSVLNLVQWAGDYSAAGVTAIRMDLRNFGSVPLSLRLLLSDPTVGPPSNVAFSADPVVLPAGSDWTSVLFPIGVGDLTASLGSVATALANATELRIFHSSSASFPGPAVVSQLGVDNVAATVVPTAVPEPTALTGMCLALPVVWRRSSRRSPRTKT